MDKKFIQLQLALFFSNDFQGVIEKASLAIKMEFGNDMGTQLLNIPPTAPAEIPRLILTSQVVNINLSKNRIDFFAKDEDFAVKNFEKVSRIIAALEVKIGRIGVVFTYFVERDIEYFKSIFNEAKISSLNLKEITVRLNEDATIEGMKCNNSQMFVSGFGTDPSGNRKSGIVVTRDVNTLEEDREKNDIKKEAIHKFIQEVVLLADRFVI